MHDTCHLVSLHVIIELIYAAKNKALLRDIHEIDWKQAIDVARVKNGKDITLPHHVLSSNGEPLLKLLLDSKYDHRFEVLLTLFRNGLFVFYFFIFYFIFLNSCDIIIYKLNKNKNKGINIECKDIARENVLFWMIRQMEAEPIKEFFSIRSKEMQSLVNSENILGETPLSVALKYVYLSLSLSVCVCVYVCVCMCVCVFIAKYLFFAYFIFFEK